MDLISTILRQRRSGQEPEAPGAPSPMDMVYSAQAHDLMPNKPLESAVPSNAGELHPVLAAIQQHSGFLNLLRNLRNKKEFMAEAGI